MKETDNSLWIINKYEAFVDIELVHVSIGLNEDYLS